MAKGNNQKVNVKGRAWALATLFLPFARDLRNSFRLYAKPLATLFLPFALCLWSLAFPSVVWAQCPMCKTGLLNSPEGQKLASGFNAGILFLFSVPFLIVGTLAWLIVHRQRKCKLERRREACWSGSDDDVRAIR